MFQEVVGYCVSYLKLRDIVHLGRCSLHLRAKYIDEWLGPAIQDWMYDLGLSASVAKLVTKSMELPLEYWMQVRQVSASGKIRFLPPRITTLIWNEVMAPDATCPPLPSSVRNIALYGKTQINQKEPFHQLGGVVSSPSPKGKSNRSTHVVSTQEMEKKLVFTNSPGWQTIPNMVQQLTLEIPVHLSWFQGNYLKELTWTMQVPFTTEYARALPHLVQLYIPSQSLMAEKEDFVSLRHLHIVYLHSKQWQCPLPGTLTHLCIEQVGTVDEAGNEKFPEDWPNGLRHLFVHLLTPALVLFLDDKLDRLMCRYELDMNNHRMPYGLRELWIASPHRPLHLDIGPKHISSSWQKLNIGGIPKRCCLLNQDEEEESSRDWHIYRVKQAWLPAIPEGITRLKVEGNIHWPKDVPLPTSLTELSLSRGHFVDAIQVWPPHLSRLRLKELPSFSQPLPTETLRELQMDALFHSHAYDFERLPFPHLERLTLNDWPCFIASFHHLTALRYLHVRYNSFLRIQSLVEQKQEEEEMANRSVESPKARKEPQPSSTTTSPREKRPFLPENLRVLTLGGAIRPIRVSQFPPHLYKVTLDVDTALLVDGLWPQTLKKLSCKMPKPIQQGDSAYCSVYLVDIRFVTGLPDPETAGDEKSFMNVDWKNPWWRTQSLFVQTLRVNMPRKFHKLSIQKWYAQSGGWLDSWKANLPKLERLVFVHERRKRFAYACNE